MTVPTAIEQMIIHQLSVEPMTYDQIVAAVGVKKMSLTQTLDALVSSGQIRVENGVYSL